MMKITNIVNGCVGSSKVNVQDALEIGDKMAIEFTANLPDSFYKTLHSRIITLESTKKSVKIGDKAVFDVEKLYGRMLVINQKWNLSLETMFQYELSPIPASLFNEYGHMREGDKAVLASKIGVTEESQDVVTDVTVADGNMLLHHVKWPSRGTVEDFCINFADLDLISSNEHEMCW